MTPNFSKDHDVLSELGLPARVVQLYGKLEFMAGTKGECWPTQATLARKLGLKSERQVENLLNQLQRLKLIDWKRGRYFNRYRVLAPDPKWISDLTRKEFRISDPKGISDRKEPAKKRTTEKNKPASQPASSTAPEAGRLAEIRSVIIESWPKVPGHPGTKLIGRIAAILGDISMAEYAALLRSKIRKVESFGLAESLARDLRDRRNGDHAAREQHAAAELQHNIRRIEDMLADPNTPAEDRAELRSMLDGLRNKPKSETGRRAGNAA